ncbi:hypothetical protein [Deinococcus sp.]|uniref:hypothetical protein n=1 Tax=Deinococcus sp. TaxID=47478 RepID=UPI0025BDF715|nr:hypothetical protein [Deinococcus sp.]
MTSLIGTTGLTGTTDTVMTDKIVAFADLDDTLFQTLRKLPGVAPDTLQAATVNTAGAAHSYSTPAQVTLMELLRGGKVTVIPVTGRDEAAMRRVTLPFTSWRVVNHGLTILTPAGNLDEVWAAQVFSQLESLQGQLHALSQQIRPEASRLGCRLSIHQAAGLPFMAVIKHPQADAQALAHLQGHWESGLDDAHPLQVIANANNVSLLPRTLGKAAAVRYLRQRHFAGAALTLGLGDSVSDLPFMQECDFAVSPTAGQLMRALQKARLMQS